MVEKDHHLAQDSLYLMTTALKGSALILTWACVLEKTSRGIFCLDPELAEGKLEKGTRYIVMSYPGWVKKIYIYIYVMLYYRIIVCPYVYLYTYTMG